ncbi:2-amino-4-hydroxy-6-hydroxymethyldihydropteridine diphosphokinase [Anaerovorax odorimutans]|uniref:2-amino-4-hydroxy-6- hydroxymethyldihydropteridine diphosphokinase n=1 Tax=Anaerovorax odorimutans TaxID=109327 RepID=UPI0004019574|nr:2-amino-4-hydroxy-6-hydroxymethyldihydropteridine diphosphokinase [Anaerovorax odorimutans]
MDKIKITNLKVFAYHGVYEEEKNNGQDFYINTVLYTNTRKAGQSDDLQLSTNYGEVCHFINDYMTKHTFNLIESVAENLAENILLSFPLISSIDLEICKPHAPIGLPFENVSVCITRSWKKAFLGIGSNLGNKQAYIDNAIRQLSTNSKTRNIRVSKIIETEPYGMKDQDTFFNGAIEIETILSPFELLDFLHSIENNAHRERKIHWGPRTLDLDILLYENEIINTENLTIPHIDMKNRIFVLEPLCELAPYYIHPVFKKSIKQMLCEIRK